jgi:hypothetical protein
MMAKKVQQELVSAGPPEHAGPAAACRFCGHRLHITFVDLGKSPLCESFLTVEGLNAMEPFYPLHVFVCDRCFLVQLGEFVSPSDIFSHYAYFSSYSTSWLAHMKAYTDQVISRFTLDRRSLVMELASNDGYLLQYFHAREIPVIGIEPAVNVAEVAIGKGIPTLTRFFGVALARELAADGKRPDLLVGNNVLAQVPDINDFVEGMAIVLKEDGIITMEFPHLVRLIEGNQFDTIYHEHFSYFSLTTVEKIFAAHGLVLFDVEELSTHGGSIRIYARHANNDAKPVLERVTKLRNTEHSLGITDPSYYEAFSERVKETKRKLLSFLVQAKSEGKTIVGYGAPGKGNTLLNYCGIRSDFLDYTVDRNPFKHGKYLPGTHIPIFDPAKIKETKPDYLLILPWNLKDEIMIEHAYVRDWGAQFVTPIPEVTVYR